MATDDHAADAGAVMKTLADPSESPVVMDWRRDAGWNTLESLLGISAGGSGPVSINDAFRQSAVLACVDIISQDVAKVPMFLRRRLPGGGSEKVEAKDHWLAKLLALDPNSEHTWNEFFQMIAIHVVLANNAFIAKSMTRRGEVRELIPVMPGRVMITIHPETGEKFYDVTRGTMFEAAMLKDLAYTLTEDRVIHCRKRVVDGLYGYATLGAGSQTMRLSKAIAEYQSRLYNNDGQQRLIFQQRGDMKPLGDDAFQRMKTELRAATRTMFRDGQPILLEPGYSGEQISMTAADAELAKMREAQVAEVARLFRVPPHKMMHFDGTKYENMETLERLYAHDTVVPVCQAIEKPMERGLLTPEERIDLFLEFDRKQIAIIDFKVRSEMLKIGLQHGANTLDEWRAEFGFNPLPDGTGSVRMFQSTMTVVDQNNEVLIPAGAQPAAQDAEDAPDDGGEKPAKGIRLVKA